MGIVFRQSVKTVIVTFTGAVLGAVITFAYAFALSKQAVGFYTNFINQAAIIQYLMQVGTGSLLLTYVQKYNTDDIKRKALISFCSIVTVTACIIFSIVYLLSKDFVLSQYKFHDRLYIDKYYLWMLATIILWSFMSLLELYLMAQSKLAISTFMREVLLRACNVVLIGMVYFQIFSFDDFMMGSVIVYIIPIIIMLYIAYQTKGFGFTTRLAVFSRNEYKEFVHFSWYHLLLHASVNILGFIDSLMLAPLDKTGMASLASYRWAIMITGFMIIPYRSFTYASYPIINQAFIDKDMDKLTDLFRRSGINILVIGIGMFLLISCNLDNLIRILPEGYEVIKPVVLILMIGKLVDMATGLNNEVISMSKYYKFNFRLSILLLIMVVFLNRILIPQYSVLGAAAGTTLALVAFNIIKMLFLWRKMNLQPFDKNSLVVIGSGMLVLLAGWFLPYIINPFIDAFIRSGIIIILYGLLIVWLKPSQDLSIYISSIMKNKKLY